MIGQGRPELIEETNECIQKSTKGDPEARREEAGIKRFTQEKAADYDPLDQA
ncbi:hypothetical protein MPNT_20151 [Candidatus Methylacidithermus pantelleriae]|uniref:Uncharacterized protein n=1 Tax=Candidatus Methylacidithermus pantelleriae TaxID=2744239 RepID=A0A8J2BLG5_9BACT|nr:hypothetical protein MPNT_20151 [Candidatus Methylacidithermus pantelleriae]